MAAPPPNGDKFILCKMCDLKFVGPTCEIQNVPDGEVTHVVGIKLSANIPDCVRVGFGSTLPPEKTGDP